MGCHTSFRLAVALFVALAGRAVAGGGPQNAVVVVNDQSARSQALGRYYASARGIPDAQIHHVAMATNAAMSMTTFSNIVYAPLLAYLQDAGLATQVDYVVFSMDIAYAVDGEDTNLTRNGLTAATHYGFRFNVPPLLFGVCDVPTSNNASDYFAAERSFTRAGAPSSNRYFLSALITDSNLYALLPWVDRTAAADDGAPSGTVYLLHTTDTDRNVQWPQFENADFLLRAWPGPPAASLLDANTISGRTDVIGFMAGQASNFQNTAWNTFLPGALGEYLTSYGGDVLTAWGQTTLFAWRQAGCAGSYGTIVEPCAYTGKFPDARLHFWYARGFSLAESYFMAVRHPYQGILLGDPLTAPYARAPSLVVSGLVAGAVVTGAVPLSVLVTAFDAARPVDRVDAFVDGRFVATVTNWPARPGNRVELALNSATAAYVVVEDDGIYEIADGLAAAVAATDPAWSATAAGDRVQLVWTNFGASASGNGYHAAASAGTADVARAHAWTVSTNLLDPVYPAREFLALGGIADTGDLVRCVVTLTNGAAVTTEVVAAQGESAASLLFRLSSAIHANTNLQGTNGVVAKYLVNDSPAEVSLEARAPGPEGWNLWVDFTVTPTPPSTSGLSGAWSFSDRFNDNADVLRARGAALVAVGVTNAAASWTLDTTNGPDGPRRLLLVAYEGTAVRSQGRVEVPFVVDNHALACSVTRPSPGQYIRRSAAGTAEVQVANGTVTQVVFLLEGKVAAADTTPPYTHVWSAASYGAGPLRLQARADDDAGRSTLSEPVEVTIYTDDDGDGVSDQWEYMWFGSPTNHAGDADPDGDGASNAGEFLADTNPTNGASRLEITDHAPPGTPPPFGLSFASRTTRVYRVGLQDGSLADAAWTLATGRFDAAEGVTFWSDEVTNAPPATNEYRFYRVEAALP